jgi:3-oxoisoapionate kinase
VSSLLATFYGDDFTGSVDALLQFSRYGLRGRLFVGLPAPEELEEAAALCDVVGVAGIARSLPADALATELQPVLDAFAALRPRVVQYKACSTADSAPGIGSLGRVIELGRDKISSHPIPVLFAQPDFGRYTVFGHHFAAEDGTVYRLDRQPTMSSHPSTPMNESDLAVHLGRQTELPIASLPFTCYESDSAVAYRLASSDAAAVVLDAFSDDQLDLLGRAILQLSQPVFAVGSGGLSRALASAAAQALPDPSGEDGIAYPSGVAGTAYSGPRRPGPTLAVSGSRSIRTQRQLQVARDAGWAVLPLAVSRTASASVEEMTTASVHDMRVVELLASGVNVALSTHDVDFDGIPPGDVLPAIASAAAGVVSAAVAHGATERVIVCGGDTSSRVTRLLGVRSLSIAANPWSNVVLLTAHASGSPIDGVELLLKGGQVGDDDLFERVHSLGG